MTQVLINTQDGTKAIMANNIIRIEAHSNYSKLYLDNAYPILVAIVLHRLEDRLQDDLFYRIHKTHIVNRDFIAKISRDKKTLTLLNGEKLQISRRRKKIAFKLLA